MYCLLTHRGNDSQFAMSSLARYHPVVIPLSLCRIRSDLVSQPTGMMSHCSCFLLFLSLSNALDSSRPNFIFVLTDDQDVVFDSMDYMPFTKHHFESNGMTFTNSFVSTPICCPSRTESIAGRTFQNIRQDRPFDCMGVRAKFNVFNNNQSMFQKFHAEGYDTSTFGKLTNNQHGFFCEHSPPFTAGFDRIHSPCTTTNDFYGTQYMNYYPNGTHSVDSNLPLTPNLYETAMIGNASIQYLSQITTDPNHNRPFMTWIGIRAPHIPADPAPWYNHLYSNETAPRTPNFNIRVEEHHDFVSTNPEFTETAIDFIDQLWRNRIRSLLSADDLIRDIVQLLESHNILQNTYILFSSDHGYHLGTYFTFTVIVFCIKHLCPPGDS